MVLEQLWKRKPKDEPFELSDPREFSDYEDCLSCRIMGSTAFVALGGYTYFSGMKNLKAQRRAIELSKSKYKYGSRQLGILTLSATLVAVGLFRTFN